jgi:mono/diheme cytochrome c family protein
MRIRGAGVLLLLASTAMEAVAQGNIERGRDFAAAVCARCHAIGPEGDSPLAVAPPFRTFEQRFVLEWLERALENGIGRGHRDARFMPETMLSKPEIDDLIAYIKTLPQ